MSSQKQGPGIFVIEPHGIFPITMFWGSLDLLKVRKSICCLSSTMFTIPLMKHFLSWAGSTSIDRENIESHLKQGYNVSLCAGGLQEIQYWGNEKECVLFLNSRFGITKVALQNGVPIIPTFTFGLRKTYDQYIPTNQFIVWVGRKIGFFPMIFLGLGGIPYGQAKPCPLSLVLGTPIIVPKIEKPTHEDIVKYHSLFLTSMRKLYEDNQEAHGMSGIPLRIV
jgi:hypothetical protein